MAADCDMSNFRITNGCYQQQTRYDTNGWCALIRELETITHGIDGRGSFPFASWTLAPVSQMFTV
jgi:hypothetical protein